LAGLEREVSPDAQDSDASATRISRPTPEIPDDSERVVSRLCGLVDSVRVSSRARCADHPV
jgi:hypothetical protein